MKNITETIMNIWAKISSVIMIFFLTPLIILIIPVFIEDYSKGMNALLVTIIIILFYAPLFYYAWFRKPDNKKMKILAKIITIFSIVGIFVVKTPTNLIEMVIFVTPVFYYAWRTDNLKRKKKK